MLCRSRQWWSCFEHCPTSSNWSTRKSESCTDWETASYYGSEIDIAGNDQVVTYTGFPSYDILLAFLSSYRSCCCTSQLLVGDVTVRESYQFLFTLMKLKLNLCSLVLAFHFGISESLLSRYITTWVCFLYQHLKRLSGCLYSWASSTLPHAFHDKYPTTFAIIDGSEVFIDTPSDLQMQSSTWSS